MNTRLLTLKSILWAIVGVLAVATTARFIHGLGATTNLSDTSPWGIWIGFDVMAGVALAAGGFVLAATVYIFGLEKYRPFVRPAILTAFLGYIAVAVGLMYDLGLPWHIWHPMIFPQHHSVLFEVAMCVMLYLTVLGLEFAPVVLESKWFSHPLFKTIHTLLKKFTIPLVIAGIILSTLHQSSLGSLFLIAPYRVHPLWYSPIIYLLFFISAIALGLMTVTMESLLGGFFFRHKVRTDLLAGLTRASSFVLLLYVVVRLADLAVRGQIGNAFDGTWQASLFWVELLVAAVIPAALLFAPSVRKSVGGLFATSGLVIVGMVMNRINLSITTFLRAEGQSYFPSWIELAISAGIVSAAALAFIFFVENFRVYEDAEHEPVDLKKFPKPTPGSTAWFGAPWNQPVRRYSLVGIGAAALTIGLLPKDAIFGPQPTKSPVHSPRTMEAVEAPRQDLKGHEFVLVSMDSPAQSAGRRMQLMILDGDRDGDTAIFPHDKHKEVLGEESCATCHHMNKPLDSNTRCSECHRDMELATDIFSHESHVMKTGGNNGCIQCHADNTKVKTMESATACSECHESMIAENAFGGLIRSSDSEVARNAPGYHPVMHELCIECHEEKMQAEPEHFSDDFARCDGCHRAGSEALKDLVPAPHKDKNPAAVSDPLKMASLARP